jgi:hypothetical protein
MKLTHGTARAAGIGFAIFVCALLSLARQDKPRESVTVTAVEVPVRVFDKSGYISGLTKEDFEVFEDGVKQVLTGFESVSRALSPVAVALPEAIPQAPRKRNFLLIFNVFDYTPQIGEAIDYFFKDIYRGGDRLIIIVEDKFFDMDTTGGVKGIAAELKKTLTRYKKISRWEIGKAFLEIDRLAAKLVAQISTEPEEALDSGAGHDDPISRSSGDPFSGGSGNAIQDISSFFERYKSVWLDYRRRLLDIDLGIYRSVVKKMEMMDGDKWAICFQQRDLFPRLKSDGRLEKALTLNHYDNDSITMGVIVDKQSEIRRLMDIGRIVPSETIRTIFTEANITFHLLIMKSIAPRGANDSRDLELRDVQEDYEDSLRRISQATGGLTVFSNKVVDTLREAAAKQDQYYLLVYQSKSPAPGKEREIDVKVRRRDADVVALKRFVGQKPPLISIAGFELKNKRVGFDITSAGLIEKGGWNTGKIAVKVTVFDGKSARVFSEAKAFDLMADSIHLSLNFEKLASGDHFIIIEATDLVTGEKDVLSRAIVL